MFGDLFTSAVFRNVPLGRQSDSWIRSKRDRDEETRSLSCCKKALIIWDKKFFLGAAVEGKRWTLGHGVQTSSVPFRHFPLPLIVYSLICGLSPFLPRGPGCMLESVLYSLLVEKLFAL